MYITKEQLDQRLNKTSVLIKERERKVRGSVNRDGKGEDRLTHDDRVAIGILGNEISKKDAAEIMGVSAQTVSLNSRGLVAETSGVDKELRDAVVNGSSSRQEELSKTQDKLKDALISNLAAAIGHVANNLHTTDAPEASKIAVDMSKILDRVSGGDDRKGNRTAIIINVPAMKEEKQYQSITV